MSAPGWTHRGYRVLLRCISGPALAWLWWRGRKDPGYREGMAQRLGRIEPTPASIHGILIHAASVGEVQAAEALIRRLRQSWPDHSITVTTQTPTGARKLQALFGDAIQHLFFPVDTPGATARFLDRLQPSLVILIEREIWPEWMHQCRARAIPVALVNARLSEASAASYRRWQRLMQGVWPQLALAACADEETAARLQALGVPAARLHVTGNLKFDQPLPTPLHPAGIMPSLSRSLVVAGSTHEGEESALLDAWPAFQARHPDAILVLVPRHPERFDSVARAIEALGLPMVRRSRGDAPDASTSVWLGDTMGELAHWYAEAQVCFIGGTLVPVGGHNPLEAMALGKAVLFGPHTHNADAVYSAIEQLGAGQRAASAAAVLQTASEWLSAPDHLQHLGELAQAFVRQQQGASEATFDALQTVWQDLQPSLLGPVTELRQGLTTVWFDPDVLSLKDGESAFALPEQGSTALATGSGRGQAQRLTLQGHDVVLRHYRRGGLVARFNPDRYRRTPARSSRAMQEFSLLRPMRALNLPVPAPVAARQVTTGRHYTADIIVAMLPGTRNVVQRLVEGELSPEAWRAIGQAIRRLHDAQIHHSDLNAHNILLDTAGQAWIVDFDKCDRRHGEDWKALNLQRLLRSLNKEAGKQPAFHWRAQQFDQLLAGYDVLSVERTSKP